MQAEVIEVTNGSIVQAAKRLKEMKEISLEQYAEILRRVKEFIE